MLFVDDKNYNGYAAFSRNQLDENSNATILINDDINIPGFIESWFFYANITSTPVHLQVWRPIYDFKVFDCILFTECLTNIGIL